MTKYKRIKADWEGSMGMAVRALLSLKKDSGAWLWFQAAMESLDGLDNLTAGVLVRAMLRRRLKEMEAFEEEVASENAGFAGFPKGAFEGVAP